VGPPWSQPFILGEGPRVVLAPRRRGTTRGSRPQGGGPAPRAATGRRGGASRPRSRLIAGGDGDEATTGESASVTEEPDAEAADALFSAAVPDC